MPVRNVPTALIYHKNICFVLVACWQQGLGSCEDCANGSPAMHVALSGFHCTISAFAGR